MKPLHGLITTLFANLDKFQAMISKKDNTDTKDLEIRVGKELIKSKEQVI